MECISFARAAVDRVPWGTWVAQSVKHWTFGFGSGHDLMVHEIEPLLGPALTAQSLLGILSPTLPCSCSLSLSQYK